MNAINQLEGSPTLCLWPHFAELWWQLRCPVSFCWAVFVSFQLIGLRSLANGNNQRLGIATAIPKATQTSAWTPACPILLLSRSGSNQRIVDRWKTSWPMNCSCQVLTLSHTLLWGIFIWGLRSHK